MRRLLLFIVLEFLLIPSREKERALDVFCLCVEAFAMSPFLYRVGNCFDRDGDVFGILGSCS